MADVHPQVLAIALDHATGQAFEEFVSEFQAAILGPSYVPVGGTADGGADGYITDYLRFDPARPEQYLQSSTTGDVRGKIRHTIKRLRDVGREPAVLTYFSSGAVTNVEQVENDLSTESSVLIRIRDRRYIAAQINNSAHSQSAFEHHLAGFAAFLNRVGAAKVVTRSNHIKHPDVLVFLRQEVDRREGEASLVNAVVDGLIVWALEGTDPVSGQFMSRSDIATKILSGMPSAKPYIDSYLDTRLEAISRKDNPGGRLIRWHKAEDLFVLPYETRRVAVIENAEDEAIREGMTASLHARFEEFLGDGAPGQVKKAVSIALRALQLAFENEGLAFAHFVNRTEDVPHYHYLSDALATAMDEVRVSDAERNGIGDATIEVFRSIFYSSMDVERRYLERLSRTYSILFTLQAEPRLIDYFEEMSGSFYLYVGSDLLIRALSERYLAPADQITRNMLGIAAKAGATLVLAEPVLDEVVHHLRASDHEFVHHVAPGEEHVTPEMARQASRILIRTYLYARLGLSSGSGPMPSNWPAFVHQFCDHSILHKPEAFGQLRPYLQSQFTMQYVPRKQLEGLVSPRELAELSEDISTVKSTQKLADNDALMCLAVYGRREKESENSGVSEFGYKTWWLTGGETAILRFTDEISKKRQGDRFIMRPEFLLNFISLSPSAADARDTFENVFPTLLGIRLARRMDEQSFEILMDKVAEVSAMEEGRRAALIAKLCDGLKSDQRRQYRTDFQADRKWDGGEWVKSGLVDPAPGSRIKVPGRSPRGRG